jgi:hypothetical protein
MDEVGSPSIDVASYYFNIYALDDMQKVRYSVKMFTELFGMSRFDQDNIIRFTLTVRKNYRRVPYHNWAHGFSVANSVYSIIKHNNDVFNANEVRLLRFCIIHASRDFNTNRSPLISHCPSMSIIIRKNFLTTYFSAVLTTFLC